MHICWVKYEINQSNFFDSSRTQMNEWAINNLTELICNLYKLNLALVLYKF